MHHRHDVLDDRDIDTVMLGQFQDGLTGLNSLSGLAGRGHHLCHAHALPELHAEPVVARQRRHARGNEVADPCQTCKRHRVSAQGHAQAQGLSQPPSDDRGLGVVSHPHALGHADGEGDDVLDRTTELGAHHVGVGVRPKVGRGTGQRHPFGHGLLHTCHNRGCGLLGSDLPGQVWPRHDHDALRADVTHLGNDLAHPLGRA